MVVNLLDEEVVRDVRREAKAADRSMAGQVEHWLKLGRAVDAVLNSAEVGALKSSPNPPPGAAGVGFPEAGSVKARIVEFAGRLAMSTDRESARTRILAHGGPVYEADPPHPGRVVRIMPSGKRTTGRVRKGVFAGDKG